MYIAVDLYLQCMHLMCILRYLHYTSESEQVMYMYLGFQSVHVCHTCTVHVHVNSRIPCLHNWIFGILHTQFFILNFHILFTFNFHEHAGGFSSNFILLLASMFSLHAFDHLYMENTIFYSSAQTHVQVSQHLYIYY